LPFPAPDQQDALRDGAAEALIFLRLLQEVDDLDEFRLDLVDPCYVGERGVGSLGVVEACAALPKRPRMPPAPPPSAAALRASDR